jgi:iron complex outermembrane receptor protein
MVFAKQLPVLVSLLMGAAGFTASGHAQAIEPVAAPAKSIVGSPANGAVSEGRLPPTSDETVKLDAVKVEATNEDVDFDATGMGSYEQQLRDLPFSNDMISSEGEEDDPAAAEVAAELQQIAMPSAVDLATGDSRLSLRGFPSPLMRNGFTTMGASDMLNTSRTIVIQGALVPVLGRAAPGGILDYITALPRSRAGRVFSYGWTSVKRQNATMEITGPAVPKRAWQRVAAAWSRRVGPERFAVSETRNVSSSLTWRHSAAASTLFALDFQQVHATAAPGIPEYRPATGAKIVGPYLPLAGFNALGPEAGVRRRTTAATVLFDGQPHPKIAVRAGLEAWWRRVEQDRFTVSVYNVASGRFDGIREPRHLEQPQRVQLAHLEVTGRFSALRAEHKLMASASHTWGVYLREERALSTADRNALPVNVRIFRPEAPDYSRPAFSRERYNRIIANREESARYAALNLSHRAAVAKGRFVFTSGLRQDRVGLEINDLRPDVALPRVKDNVDQLTYHLGLNYQAIPSRLLLFATTSTAFEPSSRVDSRTGRIQDNETTRGYEAGLKGRFPTQKIDVSASGFLLYNEHISRRNPLYDDPIFDANQTQPQLVAAGEETFSGFKIDGRWRATPRLSFSGRAAYAHAITTASPDLPQEVGRAITRLPPLTASGVASFSFPAGFWKGLSLSSSVTYVAGYTAYYEDAQREGLDYTSYALTSVSASRSFKIGKYTHGIGLSLRNALDYDLLEKQSRLGAGRELAASYRLMF